MKKAILSICLLMLAAAVVYPQRGTGRRFKYYRVDRVKTFKGEILEIKKEECYRNINFMVIYLKEKKSGVIYRVEVSPGWFYDLELMKGSAIEVTGSNTKTQAQNLVIARSITFRGESYYFRDKYGFPLWQGKQKQMRRGGKGRMRRKGNR
ncbi:MAG: hypothetical protein KAT34_14185 [Candidatus Aminicenantes bacterium]|jgi:hypothetical protein|nr:hypothetical protein [Candidatus Aminicenantes bacterium]